MKDPNYKHSLVFPSALRGEVQKIKTDLKQYYEAKQKRHFIKRRARLVKNAWRNGIVGVELPNEQGASEISQLYQSNQD